MSLILITKLHLVPFNCKDDSLTIIYMFLLHLPSFNQGLYGEY